MNTYLAKLIFNISIENNNPTSQFDEQIRMIQAKSAEDAFLKARTVGRKEEETFLNANNEVVNWKFIDVADLYPLQGVEDGGQLYSLTKLRQQLQPHFLFNSLNSISALIPTKPEEARKMTQQLSDFLRGTLKKDDQLVKLSEELEHLKLYLDIEKVRFGHRLNIEFSTSPESLDHQLPSLLLQPIVENAIKFGLYDTTDDVTINIATTVQSSFLQIIVKNPFDAATSKAKQGVGFGLSSVQRRLQLLYMRQDLLLTEQKENTFITILKIPEAI